MSASKQSRELRNTTRQGTELGEPFFAHSLRQRLREPPGAHCHQPLGQARRKREQATDDSSEKNADADQFIHRVRPLSLGQIPLKAASVIGGDSWPSASCATWAPDWVMR